MPRAWVFGGGGGGGGAAATYHGVSLTDNTGQSLANGAFTTLTWNTEQWDTDGYHDTVTNKSRITIPAGLAGKYLVTAVLGDNVTADSFKWVEVQKNGATAVLEQFVRVPPTLGGGGHISGIVALAVADYIELLYRVNGAASQLSVTAPEVLFQATFMGV